jgi:hypothetical protein
MAKGIAFYQVVPINQLDRQCAISPGQGGIDGGGEDSSPNVPRACALEV